MKKIALFILALCLCFTVFGGTAFAETVAAETPAEKPAEEMTAEELYKIGKAAKDAEDYAKALKYCQLAADLGFSEAIKEIGNLYCFGLGMEQDYDKAFEYYQKAADLGNINAVNNLGNCYLNGHGVEQNEEEAVEYYRTAAEQGNAIAQNNLGNLYLNGRGVSQDYGEAVKYYILAADQGFFGAQNMLGYCYEYGLGVEQDYGKAFGYYQQAAAQGDMDAQHSLGLFYLDGTGVEQNDEDALKYIRMAAEQGNPEAQTSLGYCYSEGRGVATDYGEAMKYFQLAAEQGSASGQYNIGYSYWYGEGVEQDHAKAMEYFRLAAEQGYPVAIFRIGDCYYLGEGVEKDLDKAAEYYREAIDAGYVPNEEDQKHLEAVPGKQAGVGSAPTDGGQILDGRWLCADIQGNVTSDTPAELKNDYGIYVNKDWILQAEIPEGEAIAGAGAEAARTLKDRQITLMKNTDLPGHDAELVRKLYKLVSDWDYRNEQGTEPVKPAIEALKAIDSMDSLLAYMENKDALLHFFPMSVGVGADLINPDIYITQISTPSLILVDSAEYKERTQAGEQRFTLNQQISLYMLQRIGFGEAEANAIIGNGMAFESKMAGHIRPAAAKYQADYLQSIQNYYTEEELVSLAGSFPIMDMIEAYGLAGGKRFWVTEPDYIASLQTLFTNENVSLIRDWLIMKAAKSASALLDQETMRETRAIENRIMGITGEKSDDDIVLEAVSSLLSVPMDNLYIQAYCSEKQKEDILRIIDEVIETYREILGNVDWLSEATREKAVEKLDHMRVNAVYPDELGDWSGLDFPGLEENGSLLEAKTAVENFVKRIQAAKIDQPVDKDKWDQLLLKTAQVNAYYNPADNSINILAGILQGDFYREDMSEAQLLGAIGTSIAHEISHAFDTNGAQYNKDGAVANWWTADDYAVFQVRAAKLASWYDGFIPFEGANFSGQKVKGEAIADMAGVKCILALAAKKANFDYDAFFRQFARSWRQQLLPSEATRRVSIDTHPMNYMRVNATLAQFDEFIDFYGIQPGDGMFIAPEDRVAVW